MQSHYSPGLRGTEHIKAGKHTVAFTDRRQGEVVDRERGPVRVDPVVLTGELSETKYYTENRGENGYSND